MGYLDHVRACTAHDLSRFLPFVVAGARVGWVRTSLGPHLCRFADTFRVTPAAVELAPDLDTFEARTVAVDRVMAALVRERILHPPRGERYAVAGGWNRPALMSVDRAYVPVFGTRAYGVHVNGVVQTADGLALWIGRRAGDRLVAPGKLDNLVAGGNPMGIGLVDNLVKEAREEAGLSADLARRARPVGALGYRMEVAEGLRDDVLFVYDLVLPPDVVPVNTDGEVEAFTLMPVGDVAERVRDTFDFKFNVALVLIDFLIRRGVITPDDPDYLDLVAGRWRLD